jgi:hypothetical protein
MRGLTQEERWLLDADDIDVTPELEPLVQRLVVRGLLYLSDDNEHPEKCSHMWKNTTLGNKMLMWDSYARGGIEI